MQSGDGFAEQCGDTIRQLMDERGDGIALVVANQSGGDADGDRQIAKAGKNLLAFVFVLGHWPVAKLVPEQFETLVERNTGISSGLWPRKKVRPG